LASTGKKVGDVDENDNFANFQDPNKYQIIA
jgi:hypothetical protein